MQNLNEILINLITMSEIETDKEKKDVINRAKAQILEEMNPSTKKEIIYFLEETLTNIKEGYSNIDENLNVVIHKNRRSLMEFNKLQRHPVTYCILKYEEEYFFVSKKDFNGEFKVIEGKGFIEGHLLKDDIVLDKRNNIDLKLTLRNGIYRELEDTSGITKHNIKSVNYKGVIKSLEGVEQNHLGFIYEIELNSKDINTLEKGIWVNKYFLPLKYEKLEKWAKIVYNNVIYG